MLETLTKEIWADCLNERFIVAGSIEMELLEVNSLGHKHPRAGREPFSLVFRGPKAPVLIQKIYPLEHRSLGALDLFLVPIGPDQAGMRYAAIFT
ncbi:MAG: DUF6916 family protein [Chromatiales bacterium]